MQAPGDVLLIFDCCPLPRQQPQYDDQGPLSAHDDGSLLIEAGMVSSPSTKQLLGICATPSSSESPKNRTSGGKDQEGREIRTGALVEGVPPEGIMTPSLCRVLNGIFAERQVSVQNLCSNIKEDLRARSLGSEEGKGYLSSKVFVTQLGGGQLGDICLPWFRD